MRLARDATQSQVAERAGYSAKYVNEIETGKRPDIPFSTLRKIVESGLSASLADVFADFATKGRRVKPREALPPHIEELAREIAELPEGKRHDVLAIVRAVVRLAG